MADILDQTKQRMIAAIEHLKQELNNIRTGRANPSLLDSVKVEVYGTQMRLKELATVTSPEPLLLVITPFDKNNSEVIGSAIQKANLGMQPIVDGNMVRIPIPPMDQQRRDEYVKLCHKNSEECKVSVRNVRRESNDLVRKQKNDGDLTEDELRSKEKKIQEFTDQFCKEVEELAQKKEKEILTI